MQTAVQISTFVKEQIEEISNFKTKSQINALLVEPYPSEREWNYGQAGETHTCWIVLEDAEFCVGIAYCSKGFGPQSPWGLLFLSGPHMSMGDDSNWYRSLEAAFIDSWSFKE